MGSETHSVESRTSWIVAGAALSLLMVGFGAPLVAAVALKPIAATLDAPRSVPALAGSAAYLGSALGGLVMGPIADRVGIRRLAAFGILMVAAGMAVSSIGTEAALLLGHGVLLGFFGLASLFAPLLTLVTRWFDRRRGTALALVSSGQYLAGMLWPNLIELGVDGFGWQRTMLTYGILAAGLMLPATLLLRQAPAASVTAHATGPQPGALVLGMHPNLAGGLISAAIFLCCVPMAMPPAHLVAFCSDAGLTPTRGAAMLSMMLGLAFFSRQFWGWLADRMGGLPTVLAASSVQAAAVAGFVLTQNEAGLFAVSALFGLGFSGIVPAYVMAIRDLFPDREASWRVPVLVMAGQGGMAFGTWLAGAIYDHAGAYAPAFGVAVLFNLANLVLLGVLLGRRPRAYAFQ